MGLFVGSTGLPVGDFVGLVVGKPKHLHGTVGDLEGLAVGDVVGCLLGEDDGALEGLAVGASEGLSLGGAEGCLLGEDDGAFVGDEVGGEVVGTSGLVVGTFDGLPVGLFVGYEYHCEKEEIIDHSVSQGKIYEIHSPTSEEYVNLRWWSVVR